MRFVEERAYVGPNPYALFPVVRFTIDLGPMERYPSSAIAGFVDGLLEAVPALWRHGCCFGEHGGFVRRLREGTWMGHILEHVALALQTEAGLDVAFGKTRMTRRVEGEYHIVFEAPDGRVGLAAGHAAKAVLESFLPVALARRWDCDPEQLVAAEVIADFLRFAGRRLLGPSTRAIVEAAERRGIPWQRLDDASFVRLGSGKHQRRVRATITEHTSSLAVGIACDKELCNRLLAAAGLPVPAQRVVESADAAVEAARAIGAPVVVKPLEGNHGRGVALGLSDPAQIRAAWACALAQEAGPVVLERFVPGHDHRLLVVNGRLVASARRVPAHVVGDGEHTVAALVEAVNRDPRRGQGHERVLTAIEIDLASQVVLRAQGMGPDSVPTRGRTVWLRRTANLSLGGTAVDVTERVHPDVAAMACRAAMVVGLDVAGIDFLTEDISRPLGEVPGAICEVNAAPGFRMHVAPSEGTPRDPGGAVVDMLFPEGAPHSVPVLALTGTNGKTTTTRMVAHIHQAAGLRVGMTSTDGVYIDGALAWKGDMSGPRGAQIVLGDRGIDVAVLEVARGGILKSGMGVPWVHVGALLNVTDDHLGMDGIETLDELAFVKSTVPKVARDAAVLNADDPRCLAIARGRLRARRVCLVSRRPAAPEVAEHVASGGLAVVLEGDGGEACIVLHDADVRTRLLAPADIPATLGGAVQHNVDNAMFAAAIAYAAGVQIDTIRDALSTFRMSHDATPGRLNVWDELPFRVIMDYGHNPAGYQAMGEAVGRLAVEGRRICVFGTRASRLDHEILACADEVARHFDLFVCRGEDHEYGRPREEVPRMQAARLLEVGVSAEHVHAIVDEPEAVETALGLARPGDLVVIFASDIARTWSQIRRHRREDSGVRAIPGTRPSRTG